MRDLKFRCYIKYDNFMFTHEDNDSDYFMVSNGKDFAVVYDNGFEQDYLKRDEYIIMQYIGLKDKNGVEIYDGDIIMYKVHNKANGGTFKYQTGIVSWDKGFDRSEKRVKYNPMLNDNPSYFNKEPTWRVKPISELPKIYKHIYWSKFHDCEVIGNIYETK